jgi:hypothetical protein
VFSFEITGIDGSLILKGKKKRTKKEKKTLNPILPKTSTDSLIHT